MAGLRDAPPGPTGRPMAPDISAAAGSATENGTWAAALAHIGFWKGDRWRYNGVVARISPRLDTYDAAGNPYLFNLDGWAVVQELRRRIGRTDLFLGARFVFMDATTTFETGSRPPDIPNPQFDTRDSGLGAVAEYDTRNNIFTPSSGIQLKASAMFFGEYLGGRPRLPPLHGRRVVFLGRLAAPRPRHAPAHPERPRRRSLLRAAVHPAAWDSDDAVPGRDRGLARRRGAVRRQLRWWLVAFAGGGWTDAGSIQVLQDQSVHAGGFGFRYLIARVLGIQSGIDVARGPEKWAFYVVFGSSW